MYTFKSKSTGYTSTIDYFLFNICSSNQLHYEVIDEGDNLSDHNPVNIVLNIPISYVDSMPTKTVKCEGKVLWSKASSNDIRQYTINIDNLLSKISIPWDVNY